MGNTPQVDRIHSDKIRTTARLSSTLVKNVARKPEYLISGSKMRKVGITQCYCMVNHG